MIGPWLETQPKRIRDLLDPSMGPAEATRRLFLTLSRGEDLIECIRSLDAFFSKRVSRLEKLVDSLDAVCKGHIDLTQEAKNRIAELEELWKRSEEALNRQRVALNEAGIEATEPLGPGIAGAKVFGDDERIRILARQLSFAREQAALCVAELEDDIAQLKAELASYENPTCNGEWVGGSGGHRKFAGCGLPATWRDDGGACFCDHHLPQNERIAQLESDLEAVKKELADTRTLYINMIDDERAAAWENEKGFRRDLATARAAMGPLGTPPLPPVDHEADANLREYLTQLQAGETFEPLPGAETVAPNGQVMVGIPKEHQPPANYTEIQFPLPNDPRLP